MTWHECNIDWIILPIDGSIRLPNVSNTVGAINWIRITETKFGDVLLPEVQKDVMYIVPLVVAQKNPTREDFYIPSSKDRSWQYHSISKNPFIL